MNSAPKPATGPTAAANQAVLRELPFHDTSDFDDAQRGHIAPLPEGMVHGAAESWSGTSTTTPSSPARRRHRR
jgi:alkyl sulfatase BDS1-like metallo-beta-lactamase superfamily hydrolase